MGVLVYHGRVVVEHGDVSDEGSDGGGLGQLGGRAAVERPDCHRRSVIIDVVNTHDHCRLGRQRVMTLVT